MSNPFHRDASIYLSPQRVYIFILLALLAHSLIGQKRRKYDLKLKNTHFIEAIDTIGFITATTFYYDNNILPKNRGISIDVKRASIEKILYTTFRGTNIDWIIANNDIILKLVNELPSFTITGEIADTENGESLVGSTIFVTDENTGTASNTAGYYSISLLKGQHTLHISSIGYLSRDIPIDLTQDTSLNISLKPKEVELSEVVISSGKGTSMENLSSVQMGKIRLSGKTLQQMPSLLGENDPIKTVQLLPGVISGAEGVPSLFVRGGDGDQNLILIDNAPIYNTAHFLGIFSILNASLIKEVTLYKGGIPATYGTRLSSVLDVLLKEGDTKKPIIAGNMGSISAGLSLEKPLFNGKGAVTFAGRRTYLDFLLYAFGNKDLRSNAFYFYDLNFKLSYKPDKKNKYHLSGYLGQDKLGFQNTLTYQWGNQLFSFRWQKILSEKWFSDLTTYLTRFQIKALINLIPDLSYKANHNLNDIGIKQHFSYFPNPSMEIDMGIELIHHRYFYGQIVPLFEQTKINKRTIDPAYAFESSVYVSFQQNIGKKVVANYGLRYSRFSNIGPGKTYQYDVVNVVAPSTSEKNIVDTLYHNFGKKIYSYSGLEPRLSFRYALTKGTTLEASYNLTRQYLHQLSNTNVSRSASMWAPVNQYIKPQIGQQIALGIHGEVFKKRINASIEGYAKWLDNQIDFKSVANLTLNDHLETDILLGKGFAYGIELLLSRSYGKHSGWISYTFSRTNRKILGINNDQPYPTSFDRRHNITAVYTYIPNKHINFALNWIYSSGLAFTFPVAKYEKDTFIIPFYTDRNGFRLPSTHRLDLSVTVFRKMTTDTKNESSFNFSVYNVYARKNTYAYIFRQNDSSLSQTEAVKVFLFTIIPSFTYNFKF